MSSMWAAAVCSCRLPPRRRRLCLSPWLCPAEVRDSIPSGWSPQGTVWRVVIEPQQDEGEEELEVPSECREGGAGWVGRLAAQQTNCVLPDCLHYCP